jgi:NitT/TauT family transport system substrate-binding protein
MDPATRADAIKIMAAKVGANVDDYAKNVPGTHFLTLAEAKAAFKKGPGLDSVYGSMTIGNQFNLDNKVYTDSQNPDSYLAPGIVLGLK